MSKTLEDGWRVVLAILGVGMLVVAMCFYRDPPNRHATETTTTETQGPPPSGTARSTQTKDTTAAADPGSLSLALLTSGFLLLVIAANGLKIAKISKEGAEFVVPSNKQVKEDEKKARPVAALAAAAAPVFAHLPRSKFVEGGTEYEIFAPAEVPARVLNAAATHLQQSVAASDFDYACRKRVAGHQVWLLKRSSGETLEIPFNQ